MKTNTRPASPKMDNCILESSTRLVSMLDMVKFVEQHALKANASMAQIMVRLTSERNMQPTRLLDDSLKSLILFLLGPVEEVSDELDLKESKKRIRMLKLQTRDQPRAIVEFFADFEGLQREFLGELSAINFAFIPADKLKYFEQSELFQKEVNVAFPSAALDIKNAGNCRATEMHAAAVYYLMCVVDVGLVALAHRMRVKIKKTPLEYAGWQTMIDGLEAKMKQRAAKPSGNKRSQSEARKFYNGLLAEFKFFKDMRNDTMHARNNYNEAEAENAFIRVRDFMQRLTTNGISEKP